MNDSYLERAKEKISDPRLLSIIASRRARQLARGGRPMVKTNDQEYLDIALLEIAEGLIECEPGDE
jgi:DNA-directed RNA polymerase omega subunit